MQFMSNIIKALQTVMEALGVKMDTQVTALGSMETKLYTEITKLQSIIDGQYAGELFVYGETTGTVQYEELAEVAYDTNADEKELTKIMLNVTGNLLLRMDTYQEVSGGSTWSFHIKLNDVLVEDLVLSDCGGAWQEDNEILIDGVEPGDLLAIYAHNGDSTARWFKIRNLQVVYDEAGSVQGL